MNNLYVVESPLQALCAVEVSLGKKDQTHNIIVRTSGGRSTRNDEQMLAIVAKFEWDNKTVIFNKPTSVRYLNYMENINFLNDIKDEYRNNIDSLYIGEFTSTFMHMIRTAVKAPNIFLLDDGAVTVRIIKDYVSKNYNYPYDKFYPNNFFKRQAYKLLFRKYIDLKDLHKNIKVITAFSEEKASYIENMNFKNLKALRENNKSIDSNSVYYFGSLYSEGKMVSFDYEMSVLNKVKKFYDDKDKKVYYFAHRNESVDKLKLIESRLGFEVVVSNQTAEMYLLDSEFLPYEVAGAFTSVLNNVKVIFPEVPLRSFKFDVSQMAEKYRDEVCGVYEYFASINIPLQD